MMQPQTYEDAKKHAAECAPRESCGLVLVIKGREVYRPCRNMAADKEFLLDPLDYAKAEDDGEVMAVVHSHVNAPVLPSDADRKGCEESGLPWFIVGHPSGAVGHLAPSGWKAPLIGRQFHYGVLDCYTLARDYYREELGIELKDIKRTKGWEGRGENLCAKSYEERGFKKVDGEPRKGDLLLFQIFYPVPHHVGVYTGDGFFLHHPNNRLSTRERWAGVWRMGTTHILRHEALA